MIGPEKGSASGAALPGATPPELNHLVLTGTLTAGPRESRSPKDERITLLRVEFPVADPEHPQLLWTWASCEVEVPDGISRPHAGELQAGAPVLVAGQLSERWVLDRGRSTRRGIIIASLVHPGPPPNQFPFGGSS